MALLEYLILTLMIIIIVYLIQIRWKNKRYWKLFMELNGDKPLPIIGNAHQLSGNSEEIFDKVIKMWERNNRTTFRCLIGNTPFVALSDPETIEILLGSNVEITKLEDYDFLRNWLGDGLLLSTGSKWKRRRKIITPAFHFKILEQFVEVFNEKTDIFIAKLAKEKGKVFNIFPYVTLCTLDVICETAMGTNVKAQENSQSEYVNAVYKISELLNYRTYSPWKRISLLYSLSSDYRTEQKMLKILHGMTNSVIQSRKKLWIEKNKMNGNSKIDDEIGIKNRTAFLDLLLSSKTIDGDPLSDEAIREEVDTFMFEGHDTTSSCIGFAIYSMANEPHIQALVLEEQKAILGNDLNNVPTYNDLQNMNYLERVIKETLRRYPTVPFLGRHLANDFKLPDGKIIPGNTMVSVQIYCMSVNPKYFPDPEKFDPDRFLIKNTQDKHPYFYVPFSAGPRNCIGQKFAMLEIKSILSKLVRNYELITAGPEYKPRLAAELVLKSKNGINIILKDRKY